MASMLPPAAPRAGHLTFRRTRRNAGTGLGLLAGSAVGVALAPRLIPDSYSPIRHSVSESAAQAVEGAWMSRGAFLALGFAVILLSGSVPWWRRWSAVAHRTYGVAMITVAAFSHRPWDKTGFDEIEDLLHSIGASTVGFAFTVGVLLVTMQRRRTERLARISDWLAIVAGPVLPLVMMNVDDIGGLVQRGLFAIGYLWYGSEAVRALRGRQPPAAPPIGRSPG